MIKIGVTGAVGRMGRSLIEALSLKAGPELALSAAIHRIDSKFLGIDAGELVGAQNLNVPIVASIDQADFDLLVDFTLPIASLANIDYCVKHKKPVVVGTTGFNPVQIEKISAASNEIPIVLAPNMSVGINLALHLLNAASNALDDTFDIEILETHHRNKIDAPSGTALAMGEVIAAAKGYSLKECAVYDRNGRREPRKSGSIGFASMRAGDVVGEHTVLFASAEERLEITHKASNRLTFSKGALRAADWLSAQPAGLYSMQNVLGLLD